MREVSHFHAQRIDQDAQHAGDTAIANSVSQKPQPAAPPIASSQANPAPSQAKKWRSPVGQRTCQGREGKQQNPGHQLHLLLPARRRG